LLKTLSHKGVNVHFPYYSWNMAMFWSRMGRGRWFNECWYSKEWLFGRSLNSPD